MTAVIMQEANLTLQVSARVLNGVVVAVRLALGDPSTARVSRQLKKLFKLTPEIGRSYAEIRSEAVIKVVRSWSGLKEALR